MLWGCFKLGPKMVTSSNFSWLLLTIQWMDYVQLIIITCEPTMLLLKQYCIYNIVHTKIRQAYN